MPTTAEWTYEVPPIGADAAWLEEYVVYGADGGRVGTVLDVVERDGELWLAVDRSAVPLQRHRHAIPFDEIDDIDHDAATIRLKVRAGEVEEQTPELDPGKAVEAETGAADAHRVTEPPPELWPQRAPPAPAATGPRDDPTFFAVAPWLFRLSGIALLGVAIFMSFWGNTVRAAWFAIPAALFALALVALWRAWRIRWGPRSS